MSLCMQNQNEKIEIGKKVAKFYAIFYGLQSYNNDILIIH